MASLLVLRDSEVEMIGMEMSATVDLVERVFLDPPEQHERAINQGTVGARAMPHTGSAPLSPMIALFEDYSGNPCAIMDGSWVMDAASAAVTALFAREASPTCRHALIVGSGRKARVTVQALVETLETLETIFIHGSTVEAAESLIEELAPFVGDIELSPMVALRDVHHDVIVGVGDSGAPAVVTPETLRPGMLVIDAGHGIDSAIYGAADRILVTTDGAPDALPPVLGAAPRFCLRGTLSDVLNRRFPARTREDEIIVAFSTGVAESDMIVASEVYAIAQRHALGSLVMGF